MGLYIYKYIAILAFTGIVLGGETEVTIIYTHNTNGLLENCQCPEHAYGALEKRAVVIDSIRKSDQHVILLDTGDILDIRPYTLLHRHIIQAYGLMGYDAWACGDQDFIEGISFFMEMARDLPMQLVTSNIHLDGEPLGKPYHIIRAGDIRIGITGTINEQVGTYLDKQVRERITITGQQEGLERVLEDMSPLCDYVVLLSHSGFTRDCGLADAFEGINLIIGGHSQTLLEQPEVRNGVYILQAGESGYRTGVVKIKFGGNKNAVIQQNRLILLEKEYPDDPEIIKLINQFHTKRMNTQ